MRLYRMLMVTILAATGCDAPLLIVEQDTNPPVVDNRMYGIARAEGGQAVRIKVDGGRLGDQPAPTNAAEPSADAASTSPNQADSGDGLAGKGTCYRVPPSGPLHLIIVPSTAQVTVTATLHDDPTCANAYLVATTHAIFVQGATTSSGSGSGGGTATGQTSTSTSTGGDGGAGGDPGAGAETAATTTSGGGAASSAASSEAGGPQ